MLVSIPADDWDYLTEPVLPRVVSTEFRPEPVVLGQIGDALDASRRPALVVGTAVDRCEAWDAVVALAERHNASVWVAPMSGRCGFPEDHPLFAGFLPAMREKIVELLGGHDYIFAVGAPAFIYHVEGHGPHVPAGAKLGQLIDDPTLAAWTPVGTTVVGNIRLGVHDLLARPAPAPRAVPAPRQARPLATAPDNGELMSVAYVLQTLAGLRARNSIVVEEAPTARSIMHGYLPILESGGFYTMASGGLGHGMPAAVGVALAEAQANSGRRVIGLIGDGSSMYSIQALWSAAQLNLPITYVILKNRRYAALQDFAPVFGFKPGEVLQGTDLPGMDFVALARGQGCEAVTVRDADQLADVLRAALSASRPTLVEVEVA